MLSALTFGCSLETEGTGEPRLDDVDDSSGDGEEQPSSRDPDRSPDRAAQDGDSPASNDEPLDGGSDPPLRGRDGQASAADARVDSNAPLALDCTRAGVFALRVDFDVTWQGTSFVGLVPVLAPGAGQLTIYSAVTFAEDGMHAGVVKACGAAIPDFEAGQNIFAGELYGTYFPDRVWEQPTMPSWRTEWRPACSQVGCAIETNPLEALLGVRSRPPGWGPRGTRNQQLESADDDGDGYPGLTLLTRGTSEQDPRGRSYTRPPLGTLFSRADKLMLAITLKVQLGGQFDSCDRISGALAAGSVDTAALGCTYASGSGGGEAMCDASSVQFLDDNLPVWTVRSARFQAVRVPSASCAAVRAATK